MTCLCSSGGVPIQVSRTRHLLLSCSTLRPRPAKKSWAKSSTRSGDTSVSSSCISLQGNRVCSAVHLSVPRSSPGRGTDYGHGDTSVNSSCISLQETRLCSAVHLSVPLSWPCRGTDCGSGDTSVSSSCISLQGNRLCSAVHLSVALGSPCM